MSGAAAIAAGIGPGGGGLRRARDRRRGRGAGRPGGADPARSCLGLGPRSSRRSRPSIPARRHDVVVNVQGDLPLLDPAAIRAALSPLADPGCRHRHAGGADRRSGRDAGKRAWSRWRRASRRAEASRARSISAAASARGRGAHYHHIGLYAYRPRGAGALRRAAAERRWRGAKIWSSCARSRRACASTWRSLTRCPSASILRPISSAPARSSQRQAPAPKSP